MKGIILSEFVEFIEQELGEDTAQSIIDNSGVESDGAYSRIGLYDYQELIQLLTQAVAETDTQASVLLENFSDHLFMVFKRDYSVFFEGVETAADSRWAYLNLVISLTSTTRIGSTFTSWCMP